MPSSPVVRLGTRLAAALLAAVVAISLASATAAPVAAASRRPWTFSTMSVPADRPTGAGVRVAVVDSGIDTGHPAFAGRIAGAIDCVDSGGGTDGCRDGVIDDNGHGTHIAGIIGARGAHDGPEGIAPDVELLAVRSLRNTCEQRDGNEQCRALGQLEDVVAGVRWATAHGAHIINLSIDAGVGLDWRDGDLAAAIHEAWRAGAVVVASTGNRGVTIDDDELASVPLLLVGAVTASGEPASYSNLPGTAQWGLLAPGGEARGACDEAGIVSTYPRALEAAGTGCLSGTSMAAAYTSGALASLMSTGADGRAALAHLVATAKPSRAGGLVDLEAALSRPVSARATSDPRLGSTATSADDSEQVVSASRSDWAAAHPLRTRLLAAGAVAAAAVLVVGRRRGRPSLLGF